MTRIFAGALALVAIALFCLPALAAGTTPGAAPPMPHPWTAGAGLAVAVLLRLGQAGQAPALAWLGPERVKTSAAVFTLLGALAGVAVAFLSGDPAALAALDGGAIAQAVVDVLAVLGVGGAAVAVVKPGTP